MTDAIRERAAVAMAISTRSRPSLFLRAWCRSQFRISLRYRDAPSFFAAHGRVETATSPIPTGKRGGARVGVLAEAVRGEQRRHFRGGGCQWPPESADVNPRDYSLWPFTENQPEPGIKSEQELRGQILKAASKPTPGVLDPTARGLVKRSGRCVELK